MAPLAAQTPATEEASLIEHLRSHNQDLAAYTRLYQLYATQGRKPEADNVFLIAINSLQASTFGANSPRALELGDFYLACGKLDLAMKQYQAALAARPAEKATYLKRQIDVLMRQGKRNEAGALNAEVLRQNPNDKDANAVAASPDGRPGRSERGAGRVAVTGRSRAARSRQSLQSGAGVREAG